MHTAARPGTEHRHALVLVTTDDADGSHEWERALTRQNVDVIVDEYHSSLAIIPTVYSFNLTLVDQHHDPDNALLVSQRLRSISQQPILLFTYETDERFHLEAYRLGVEECILKPVGTNLFTAKVLSWLRKVFRYEDLPTVLESNHFYLDSTSKTLQSFNGAVRLSDFECRLMQLFLADIGAILEEQYLQEHVWSIYAYPDPRWLQALVNRLSAKIRRISGMRRYIKYVAGKGYVFQE